MFFSLFLSSFWLFSMSLVFVFGEKDKKKSKKNRKAHIHQKQQTRFFFLLFLLNEFLSRWKKKVFFHLLQENRCGKTVVCSKKANYTDFLKRKRENKNFCKSSNLKF